jgi:hypothetical protein
VTQQTTLSHSPSPWVPFNCSRPVYNPRSVFDLTSDLLHFITWSCLESRENDRRDPSRWPRGTLYPQRLALTLPTSGSRLVSIVRLWTQATEFSF